MINFDAKRSHLTPIVSKGLRSSENYTFEESNSLNYDFN